MNKIILTASIVVITSLNLSAAEPSAFGAGDLNNPSPYGLTSSEKTVLNNKNSLKKVVVKTNNQANEVESLRERIDGLQSIVESLSRKSHKNRTSLSKLENKNSEELANSDEYEKRLSQVIEVNTELIEKNRLLISELSKIIETINLNYITKIEFNELVNSVNEFKTLVSKELGTKAGISSLDKMKTADVAKKAKAFYDKQYYTKSIEYYSHLIRKNYKPANAHYMIGQMNFKRKNYSNAISFYKKSAALYSKAWYMPKLMLNTAISMDKTGDSKNAKAFYTGVIRKYPDSPQANTAQIKLESIN